MSILTLTSGNFFGFEDYKVFFLNAEIIRFTFIVISQFLDFLTAFDVNSSVFVLFRKREGEET
jgi:hypothetical protein